MRAFGAVAAFAGILGGAQAATPDFAWDPAKVCESCKAWNEPQEPFRIYGNTYYVGPAGLTSILIVSREGLILLDGALPQSAPLIAANVRKLGFAVEDIRLIVNSHTHYDHAGGIAALQRASKAVVAASPASAVALRRGGPAEDDPQFAFGRESNAFPKVRDVRVVSDGETLRVGDLAITARFTPGHTPGGTSWVWRSCEAKQCLDIVYADSLAPVSAPSFRFTGTRGSPGRLEVFTRSIERVAGLPCDVLLAPHPGSFDLEAKLARRKEQPAVDPFVDSQACKTYAANAKAKLDQRIADERKSPPLP